MGTAWTLLQAAAGRWNRHNASRLGAAVAYYTALSVAPLLVLVVAIAGVAFGAQAVRGEIVWQVENLVGPDIARIIQDLLRSAHQRGPSGVAATVIGAATLLLGASAVFSELRDALNIIWNAPGAQSGFTGMLRFRLFAFAVVLAVGFLLIVSLAASALLAFLGDFAKSHLAALQFSGILFTLKLVEPFLSVFVFTFLFALIYKYIPDVHIEWAEVWIGAAVTAVLFTIGKILIGLYLGKASVGSAYGAAGSLVVLLVWVYYSAQIFFFGAEFTKVYAEWRGHKVHIPAGASPSPS